MLVAGAGRMLENQTILVISDNYFVFNKFLDNATDIIDEYRFFFSTTTNENKEKYAEDVSIVNLKDLSDINYVTENFDLIISLHCKQIFPKGLVEKVKCVNVHPGYLPLNRGWYPHVFSIIKEIDIGATIHEMTTKVDEGPIIARKKVAKYLWDTSKTLYERIVDLEIKMIVEWLPRIIDGNYSTFIPEGEESYFFTKKEYEDLKEIKWDKSGSHGDFINHLRAMTHEGFNNAYTLDPVSGEKIFLSINFSKQKAKNTIGDTKNVITE